MTGCINSDSTATDPPLMCIIMALSSYSPCRSLASTSTTTLGRSSMASSAIDLEGRRWKRGRDASTLMVCHL